jgi:hypothetical protein
MTESDGGEPALRRSSHLFSCSLVTHHLSRRRLGESLRSAELGAVNILRVLPESELIAAVTGFGYFEWCYSGKSA